MPSLRSFWPGRLDLGVLISATALVVGLWIFVETADEVEDGESLRVDRAIVEWVAKLPSRPWIDEAVRDLTALGGMTVLGMITIAAAAYLLLRRKTHAFLFLTVAIIGGVLVSLILKGAYQRERPDIIPHGSHTMTTSFPSGHAMQSAIVWLTLATMLSRLEKTRWMKAYFICIGLLVSFLVGLSRVWLGVHWPTDVLAGWAAGCSWALACWFVMRLLQHRGQIEPPTEPKEEATPAALLPKDV